MKTPLALLALFLIAVPARALEWQTIGPRALGMGGAGVAMPQGPLNAYWNPAGLGMRGNTSGVQMPFSAHAALTGDVLEGANDLEHIAKNPTAYTQADVVSALNKINQPGSGLRLDGSFFPALKIKKFAVFLNASVHLGAAPFADFSQTAPNTIGTLNNSKLIIRGIQLAEFGVGYGQELPFAPGLLVGGNLKIMSGQVGYYNFLVAQNSSESNDLLRKLKEGSKTSSNFGVDLGALWDIDRTFDGVPMRPRVGVVGRNLNNPKFKQADAAVAAGAAGKFAVNPQVRFGVALSPLNWWHLAADLDMTKNLTPLDGRPSRQLSFGTEINAFNRSWLNIPLRAGIRRNVADNSKTMLSIGGGLNFASALTDASLAWSPKKITTQSLGKNASIPAEFALALSLSVLFGGGEEGRANAAPADEPAAPAREWKAAPKADDQPVPTEVIRKAAEKAHEDLKVEELKRAAPGEQPSATKP